MPTVQQDRFVRIEANLALDGLNCALLAGTLHLRWEEEDGYTRKKKKYTKGSVWHTRECKIVHKRRQSAHKVKSKHHKLLFTPHLHLPAYAQFPLHLSALAPAKLPLHDL
jgi:hypothetical protein